MSIPTLILPAETKEGIEMLLQAFRRALDYRTPVALVAKRVSLGYKNLLSKRNIQILLS
jgi:hypothetical protein